MPGQRPRPNRFTPNRRHVAVSRSIDDTSRAETRHRAATARLGSVGSRAVALPDARAMPLAALGAATSLAPRHSPAPLARPRAPRAPPARRRVSASGGDGNRADEDDPGGDDDDDASPAPSAPSPPRERNINITGMGSRYANVDEISNTALATAFVLALASIVAVGALVVTAPGMDKPRTFPPGGVDAIPLGIVPDPAAPDASTRRPYGET
jgi:hypothetical protein